MSKRPTPSGRSGANDGKRLLAAVEAGDLAALKHTVAGGADLNASYRGYTALHALIQSKPHAQGTAPTRASIAMLRWMLAHGADPQRLGGWPSVRAIVLAAITGLPEYVDILKDAGVTSDVFVHAACGEVAAVRRALARDASVAIRRDTSQLTALQCAAASRLMWPIGNGSTLSSSIVARRALISSCVISSTICSLSLLMVTCNSRAQFRPVNISSP